MDENRDGGGSGWYPFSRCYSNGSQIGMLRYGLHVQRAAFHLEHPHANELQNLNLGRGNKII